MFDRITLHVDDRNFVTTRNTLNKSPYFSRLLASIVHGNHTIDADPECFADVLRYLRSGRFPIFFNGAFDYTRYAALLAEAKRFELHELEHWIQRQGYLEAVKISYTTQVTEVEGENTIAGSQTVSADKKLDISHLSRTEKVYLCPRRIHVHRGHPEKCGQQCRSARGTSERESEETQMITRITVTTQHIFDPQACWGQHIESPASQPLLRPEF
ncbi:hypothetical protein GGR50DRAFT_697195 [Xylaria sp. CBS 124048]|nr:hypothetical protein GGR50DRAFT_697195 [Xylaria sp. CBS 124048]